MHNCCVDWASRIVKYNVNKGSIACKSLLYEGDCDCRISSIIFHLSMLRKAKFSIQCDVLFLVRLQGKFEFDHSWE